MTRPRVLIVDDDAEYASVLARLIELRQPNLQCEICTSPVEALGRLDDPPPALVIVDLEMPEMDGRAFVDRALRRGFDCRTLVVNSGYDSSYLHDLFRMGECLAVINKSDPDQQHVLEMIIDSVAQKATA